jgi:hypothetical protein
MKLSGALVHPVLNATRVYASHPAPRYRLVNERTARNPVGGAMRSTRAGGVGHSLMLWAHNAPVMLNGALLSWNTTVLIRIGVYYHFLAYVLDIDNM